MRPFAVVLITFMIGAFMLLLSQSAEATGYTLPCWLTQTCVTPTPTVTPEPTEEPTPTVEPTMEPTATPTATLTPTSTPEPTKQPDTVINNTNNTVVNPEKVVETKTVVVPEAAPNTGRD